MADIFTNIQQYVDLLEIGAIAAIIAAVMILLGGIYLLVKVDRLEERLYDIGAQLAAMEGREYQRDHGVLRQEP